MESLIELLIWGEIKMVKYLILDEEKCDYQHRITRVGLFTSEYHGAAFIQELRYVFDSKKHSQTTIELSVEAAKKMMGVL